MRAHQTWGLFSVTFLGVGARLCAIRCPVHLPAHGGFKLSSNTPAAGLWPAARCPR